MTKDFQTRGLPLFLLVLLVLAVYAQTAGFDFIRLDDHDYTFLCPFVKDGFSMTNLVAAFTTFTHAAIWMPLTYLSYMFDISLFGPGMGAHHLVNVAIHALNAGLFFILLQRVARRCTNSPTAWIPFLLAAFWALQPLRVEPVAWIAGRKELLCGTFTLLGLLCVGKCPIPMASSGRTLLDSVLRPFCPSTFLCVLGACLSKPTGFVLPVLLVVFHRFLATLPFSRASEYPQRSTPPRPIRSLSFLVLSLLLSLFTGLVAIYSQTHAAGYDARELFTAPFPWRVANAVVAAGLYLFQTFVPTGLHLDCRIPPFTEAGTLYGLAWADILKALAAWLGLVAAGVGAARSGRRAEKGWALAFALMALVPVLGVFGSFGRAAHADRFTYLPSLAVSFALVPVLMRRTGRRARIVEWGVGAYLVLLACAACVQAATFRNDYTAFSRVVACDPLHARGWSHVASEECARRRDFDAGIRDFRTSLAIEWNRDTAGQLAFALATRGRREDAADIRALGESAGVTRHPEADRKGLFAEALGMAALKERRWTEAVTFLSAAVRAPARLNPPDDACARLGVALANAGRRKEAEMFFAALAKSRTVRPAVRAFAERSLERLSESGEGVLLFY